MDLSFLRKQESRPFRSVSYMILSATFNCNWYYYVFYLRCVRFHYIINAPEDLAKSGGQSENFDMPDAKLYKAHP